ncbi:MAG: class SAM-dependent methyltransferase [Fluviicola sp.]|jgi:SAM-dependent methyltransferase|uniref:class I SAM-dependent methyltransferase n=1 Tax=Fluviicola sp. TaxID=1917219 RepID=UPI00260D5FFE|nr:class I SAM-dependent methyltransferase [Fluviicola sp.]MDF3026626.1 class SAM-dependent methyltransferase [Fluviicola sp.]
MNKPQSEFKTIFEKTESSDRFYKFLQGIFHLYPEDKFHHLIADKSSQLTTDQAIYEAVQKDLKSITPFLSALTYALPALKKQKKEMSNQVLQILKGKKEINGYLEIGSTGRYISELKKHIRITGPVYLTNDIAPNNGIADIMERGKIAKIGTFFHLDYQPLSPQIADNSLDVVTCHIGLHHCPVELLPAFVESIKRVLKPGGLFIMRDHDVNSEGMRVFASLVHTVFNLGLHETWSKNQEEYRSFRSVEEWVKLLEESGFTDLNFRILQLNDPSLNTLLAFAKN